VGVFIRRAVRYVAMNVRHGLWLLWLVAASCLGGFVGWLAVAFAANVFYSTGPPPRQSTIYAVLSLGTICGASAGGWASYQRGFPSRFSLRGFLIATTLIAVVLGLVAVMARWS
jgi:hypothetical protein